MAFKLAGIMTNTAEKANAEASETSVKKSTLTDAQWLQQRLAGKGKEPEKAEPKPEEPKTEEAPAPSEGKADAPSEETPSEDVLSKAKNGNLDDLTEAELSQLAREIGSKAVARFGELTAKRKAAEERAAALEAQLAAKATSAPEIADNPYAKSIKTSEELRAKEKELKQSMEVLEEILDASDGLGAEDVVGTGPNGESYTKKQVKEKLRAARKARDEFLPDVAQRIQKRERAHQMRTALEGEARKQIPWMEDEKDERAQKYKAMVGDERLKKIEDVDPEIAAQLPFFLAHAANSMFSRREISPVETAEKPKIAPKPPSNPSTGAAAPAKDQSVSKREKELQDRLAKTGSASDWTALRTHQLTSKRKVL